MKRAQSLSDALLVKSGELFSFVGGGGKTTAIITLAHELSDAGLRVLASTTTKVGKSVESAMPVLFAPGDDAEHDPGPFLEELLTRHGMAFLASMKQADGKLRGVGTALIDGLFLGCVADVVLVEADGSRQKSLKIPGPNEPVVPTATTVVSPVAGLDALGRPATAEHIHRIELYRGTKLPRRISPALVAEFLTGKTGGEKGVPPGCPIRPLLNKSECAEGEEAARTAALVMEAGAPRIDRVVVGSLLSSTYDVLEREDTRPPD